MEVFERLIEKMAELEKTSEHKAYYYRVSDSLTIMICGMLSSLQNISDIYDWAQEEPVREFFYEQFGIYKLPSRAQFYNLIGCVKPEKFTEVFVEWVSEIVQSENKDKTIAIDGKTICSTDQRTKDGQPLHILSAIVSESKLIIGSLPCDSRPKNKRWSTSSYFKRNHLGKQTGYRFSAVRFKNIRTQNIQKIS